LRYSDWPRRQGAAFRKRRRRGYGWGRLPWPGQRDALLCVPSLRCLRGETRARPSIPAGSMKTEGSASTTTRRVRRRSSPIPRARAASSMPRRVDVGKSRVSQADDTMCPGCQMTREAEHSTRERAGTCSAWCRPAPQLPPRIWQSALGRWRVELCARPRRCEPDRTSEHQGLNERLGEVAPHLALRDVVLLGVQAGGTARGTTALEPAVCRHLVALLVLGQRHDESTQEEGALRVVERAMTSSSRGTARCHAASVARHKRSASGGA
jgi:hypothetical protein